MMSLIVDHAELLGTDIGRPRLVLALLSAELWLAGAAFSVKTLVSTGDTFLSPSIQRHRSSCAHVPHLAKTRPHRDGAFSSDICEIKSGEVDGRI